MIDTLFPYWGPPGTVHADMPVDLVLGPCPPDMREQMMRCMEWTKEDCTDWMARNLKEDKDKLDGIEADEPPPAVFIHATEYIPIAASETGVAMFDQFRRAKNGWEFFPHQNFMVAVWEIPTHHLGLFDKDMVGSLISHKLSTPDQIP
jgi:hypothetical protein